MSLHYSKYFKTSHHAFFEKDVFDGMLDADSQLHVDPLLLKTCSVSEFVGAYEEFLDYFKTFIHLVPFVKNACEADRYYRQIVKRFTFREIPNTGLGFSKKNTHGRGISGQLSLQLADTAIDIIRAGYQDPEVFLLMPIFEDNISIDRISDMTIAILFNRVVKYTERISGELGIKTFAFTHNITGEQIQLPAYKQKPVLFLPVSILADIPIATSYDEIDKVVNYATRLKNRVAKAIGITWSQYRFYKKPDWKRVILTPKGYQEAVGYFKGLRGYSYDFIEDENEEYLTARLQDMAEDKPLNLLQYLQNDSHDGVYQVTCAILDQFKKLVEDNYMWRIFNRKGRTPDETDWQYYLLTVADTYIKASNVDIDVNRESNPGVGALDFKFSQGVQGKTIVEIKRSGHKDLLHGFVTQLPTYMKAERAEYGIFLIIREDDKFDKAIKDLFDRKKQMEGDGHILPEIFVVDASLKKSASKE